MADVNVSMRRKLETGDWDQFRFRSSSEIVSRQSNPTHTVEQDLAALETLLSGTRFYHTLASISESLTMESAMTQICGAMADGSIAMYANTAGNTNVYPTASGTVLIYRVSGLYCLVMYSDSSVNSLYYGIYHNDGSSVSWSGWQTTGGGAAITVDQAIMQGSTNPVAGGAVFTRFAGVDSSIASVSSTVTQLSTTVTNHTGNTTVHCTSAEKAAWNSKPAVAVQSAQPTNQKVNDLWFQPL